MLPCGDVSAYVYKEQGARKSKTRMNFFFLKMNENQAGSLDLHFYHQFISKTWVSQVSQMVKNPFAMEEPQEMRIWSLDWEDPLEEEMATHSSILAWEIPLTEWLVATVHGVGKELDTT